MLLYKTHYKCKCCILYTKFHKHVRTPIFGDYKKFEGNKWFKKEKKIKLKISVLQVTFQNSSSAKHHAAESCKFVLSLTMDVNTENNLDSSTEKEMMPSISVGFG